MDPRLERILPRVQKPARYTGGEYNEIKKDKSKIDTRIAFCFPDTYEIGMSNLGMKILYGTMNEPDYVWCERVYAPWGDMEDEMRKNGIPLYALESGDPIKNFDIIAFSIGYEMAYTNILNMLDLAGLSMRADDRHDISPIVIAGGTCCLNPEPLADFIDLFILGEGEDVNNEVIEAYRSAKKAGLSKAEFLKNASEISGIYVPSLYSVKYNEDGTICSFDSLAGAPKIITKRIVQNFNDSYFPENIIVPSTEIVHDRVTTELFRGCIRGCRFCQAGFVYRPVRPRSLEKVVEHSIKSLKNTGYQEITLSSLSTSDYRPLNDLCDNLLKWCEPMNIGLSLPSLRADNFSMDLMQRVQKVRKSGLTFAPEAGSQRLRDVINKNVKEEDVLNSCRIAFEGGWSVIKLYFMMGLPTETEEDIIAIAELANQVLHTWRKYSTNKNRGVKITVSTSCFVPKAHTPFQWEKQDSIAEFNRKQTLLRENIKARNVTYNWHDATTSYLEAVLARGDRKLGKVLEYVVRHGGKMDSWEEYFSYNRWMDAFTACGIDPEFYTSRERSKDEILPWDMISVGIHRNFFWKERENAYKGIVTPDCRHKCSSCGANLIYKGGRCDE